MRAFWERGVTDTTLSDLEAATGADRSTLYNSFDGKDGLHRAAAALYVDEVERMLFEPLDHGTAGLADIVEFVDRLSDQITSQRNPAGCFIVNDLGSPGRDVDQTNRYLTGLEDGLLAALQRAADRNEVRPEHVEAMAKTATGAIIGANLSARHAGAAAARAMLDGIRSTVATWAIDR
ncbi:MAG: TetR/AcrR family transcriptional regulator [Ilumatobacter sp.]|nr:TetR/AcrR family transcriptional regulator [Ilumatobacter sp.]